jgi:nitrite reductase/ring-hydroxylating ferredoxin subunit/uncharacterized membrane protein
MKSKASINGHPIHVILIHFPIALFIAALAFDVLSVCTGNMNFSTTAFYIETAGVVMGLAAAIPGLIDFIFSVPPNSSAKKRAAIHGILNVLTVFTFIVAIVVRQNDEVSQWLIIAIETLGVIMLSIAGYMGGTLVTRNQISVYNRYADKGKWNEANVEVINGKAEVATTDELKTDQMKLVHVNGKRIVIGKTNNGYVAFDDRCTHKGGSLAGGVMICDKVQCPWHGSQFNVNTGEVTAGPAKEKIATYKITVEGNKVFLTL